MWPFHFKNLSLNGPEPELDSLELINFKILYREYDTSLMDNIHWSNTLSS